jgi:hypothetical protein
MSRPAAIVIGLALCAPWAAVRADVVDRIAASVNDTAIPESEVRKQMLISALQPEPNETAEQFRARVLDALIEEHLEYDDAVRFGPAPPDAAEINRSFESLREKLRADGKNPDEEFTKAGMTPEQVRASLARQLVIARYLRERFAPVAYADEEQAREEYEKRYGPERRAAGLPVPPFESVADEMRKRYSDRAFDQEVARWLKDLRAKARISIYRLPLGVPTDRTPVVLSTPPSAKTPPARANP